MRYQKISGIFIQVLLILLTQTLNTTSKNLTSRIFGGYDIDISEAKFVVQVITDHLSYLHNMCGGSLVTPLYVITAAHCVHHVPLYDIIVIGGATYYQEEGIRRRVRRKHMNENRALDIAVLKLQTALRGPNIDTIQLCNTEWKIGDLFNVYGWGKTSENDDINVYSKRKLREVQVPVIDNEECEVHFNYQVPNNYYCAGVLDEKDSLDGDFGGPAVFNNQLCGVASGGDHRLGMSIYVDINYVKNFIMRYIQF